MFIEQYIFLLSIIKIYRERWIDHAVFEGDGLKIIDNVSRHILHMCIATASQLHSTAQASADYTVDEVFLFPTYCHRLIINWK